MKIKNIQLQNFAKYDQVSVSFDDNITYLVGKNGSGKSTLGITAIWFMFQGIAEKASGGNNPLIGERFRFIGNNAATAKGEMTLYDEAKGTEIKVLRKLTKSGTDLSFIGPDGMVLDQKWLTDLFNIFLIAPKRFQELSPKDQARAIGINTSKFDTELADLKKKYTEINAVFRSYGDVPSVEKVDKVDVSELIAKKSDLQNGRAAKRKTIADTLNQQYLDNKATNETTRNNWNASVTAIKQQQTDHDQSINKRDTERTEIIAALDCLVKYGIGGDFIEDFNEWMEGKYPLIEPATFTPPAEPPYKEERPDDKELVAFDVETTGIIASIDHEIQSANDANTKALLYEQYLQKVEAKNLKEKELNDNKTAQETKDQERIGYIKAFNLPFANMSVGEEGELLLSGKPLKEPYFSTGELLKIIPILISTSNPEFKYVFLQDFNLLDDEKQEEVTSYLTEKGFQLVIEYVSKEPVTGKNCILLKDNLIVDSYEQEQRASLV